MSPEKDLKNFEKKTKQRWIWYYKLKEWEHIIRVFKNPDWSIKKVVSGILKEIIVNFNGNDRFFIKEIKVNWEVYSVKKFKRFYSPVKIK